VKQVIRPTRTIAILAGMATLFAGAGNRLEAQEPDSVVAIEPVLVRVLGSSIGTGAPYPISVLSGPALTRGTMSSFIEEAVRGVPGVQIHNRYNFAVGERIAVRGFGPRSQFGVRGIRVLVDGIPATLPDGQATLDHLDLAGLGRVEALRGPNAALYGNGAGGVLHFRTTDPATVPAAVSARFSSSTLGASTGPTSGTSVSHSLWNMQANVTGTSGQVGYRVGFSRTDFDGYRRNPIADDGSAYGKAVRSVINGTVSTPLADGVLRIVANGLDMEAENPGSLNEMVLGEGDRAAHGFNVISASTKDIQQGQLGASWEGMVGSMGSEFAVWGIRRELDNPIPGRVIALDRNAGGFRTLFRNGTDVGGGALSWGAGFEVELQKDDRQNFENDGGDSGALLLDQNERVRGAGIFLQGRYDASERLSLLAGLRYDNVGFSVDDSFVTGDPDDSGSRSMDAVSPSVGVVVAAAEGLEFFGSLGRSFETPTTTELANQPTGAGGFNPDLEPQVGVSLEVGARANLAQRLAGEVSIFRTTLEDGLVPFEVASDPGRTYFRNAAQSKHTGVEVSVDASPHSDVTVRLAYTRVNARYDVYETDSDDFAGNRIPGLAPNRFDGVLTLERGPGYVEVRGLWQDDVPVDDAGSSTSPSYFVADANIGLNGLDVGRLVLTPFLGVANILDETYNSSVVPNAFGSRYFEPAPPRNYRFGLGVTWGP